MNQQTPLWALALVGLIACLAVLAVTALDRTAELRGDVWVQQTRVANLERLLTASPSPTPTPVQEAM